MKRLTLTVIAACMLFLYSCGGDNADLSPVSAALASPPAAVKSDFTLNIRFGDELTTLLFAMGSFDADYQKNTVTAKMSRTVLASASTVELSYDGKTCVTTVDGEKHSEETAHDEIFGSLIYARPLMPSDGLKFTSSLSADGLYTVKCKNPDSKQLFGLLGDDIYTIAYIKTPKKDKMYCTDAVFTYRVKDGKISDYSLSYTAHLFDTPPYVPGIKVDESDYELELFVEFTAQYK